MKLRALVAGVLILLSGCSVSTRQGAHWDQDASLPAVSWPQSGGAARIALLKVVTPQTVLGSRDGTGFMGWLTGQRDTVLPLLAPYAVVADGDGRIWVADPESAAVHKFDLQRQKIDYWFAFDGINLLSPVGLGIDLAREQIYVADSGLKRVFVVGLSGDLRGELHLPAGFLRPTGVAVDRQGQVYVADSLSGQVEVFAPTGEHLRSIGSGLDASMKFNVPISVAVDSQERLLVNDSMNFRIELFDPSGHSTGSIGGIGDVPGSFARPRGVAVDSDDHVYVVDAAFGNVQIFSREGALLLFFGKWGDAPGEFSLPAGAFLDQHDRLYVVDSYNHRVQIFQYLKASGS